MVLVLGLLLSLFLRSRFIFVGMLVRLARRMGVRFMRVGVSVIMLVRVNQVAVTMLVSMCVGVLMHVRLD